jgi:predicted nucleotidyltransferase
MVTQAQISEITKRIIEHSQPEKVILFGSYAKGNPTEDSDLGMAEMALENKPEYTDSLCFH